MSNLPEDAEWAAGVAARLRLVQVTCAGAAANQRRGFLAEAILDALAGLPEARKGRCLSALSERFPVWNAEPGPGPAEEPVEMSASEALQHLIARSSELSAEEKQEFGQRLQAAGLLPGSPATPEEAAADLNGIYELPHPMRVGRVISLFKILLRTLENIDEVACKTVQKLPVQPDFQTLVTDDLLETIKAFLVAEDEAGLVAVKKMIERHRDAMVALMASTVGTRGVPSVGAEFARWFFEFFSPQNLEDLVRLEHPFLDKLDARLKIDLGLKRNYWKKYAQRFREELSTPEHIDQQLKQAVANTAQRIFQLRA